MTNTTNDFRLLMKRAEINARFDRLTRELHAALRLRHRLRLETLTADHGDEPQFEWPPYPPVFDDAG